MERGEHRFGRYGAVAEAMLWNLERNGKAEQSQLHVQSNLLSPSNKISPPSVASRMLCHRFSGNEARIASAS
jgi:hypothetical protein